MPEPIDRAVEITRRRRARNLALLAVLLLLAALLYALTTVKLGAT